jgi:hypothetical protein
MGHKIGIVRKEYSGIKSWQNHAFIVNLSFESGLVV